MVSESIRSRVQRADFPRSSRYDPEWVLSNQMGPNALWLMEALTNELDLRQGMRVLDLGCGRAMTSVFLAREFDIQVIAHDYWISPSENWQRVIAAGEQARVAPVHAEAHALPFADGYFDAIVSVDAYHYFGTDDLYIERVARLLRPGGRLGVVVPGFRSEPEEWPPAELAGHWAWDFASFHGPEWWRRHWQRSGKVDVDTSDWLANGHELWTLWEELVSEWTAAGGESPRGDDLALLRADVHRLLGFTRVCATTPSS